MLGKLMKGARKVVGTFTRKPSEMMDKENNEQWKEYIKKYLDTLRQYYKKIDRICVLEQEEIKGIIENEENGVGELSWFQKNVPANRTIWAETRSFLSDINVIDSNLMGAIPSAMNHMVDFAIFDDILLMLLRSLILRSA